MSERIEEYLQRARAHLVGTPLERSEQVRELRLHLQQSMERLRTEHPDLSEADIMAQTLGAFGDPADLQLPQAPHTPRTRARLAALRRRPRLAAAILVGLLLVVAGVGAAQAILDRDGPTLYRHTVVLRDYNGILNQTFVVASGTPSLGIHVTADPDTPGLGALCNAVDIVEPNGTVAVSYRTLCVRIEVQLSAPPPGTWTLRMVATGFTGSLETTVDGSDGE